MKHFWQGQQLLQKRTDFRNLGNTHCKKYARIHFSCLGQRKPIFSHIQRSDGVCNFTEKEFWRSCFPVNIGLLFETINETFNETFETLNETFNVKTNCSKTSLTKKSLLKKPHEAGIWLFTVKVESQRRSE